MKMIKAISLMLMLLLLNAVSLTVCAGSVHKWVDAQGVTHYSDQLPKASAKTKFKSVKQIDVLDSYSSSSRSFDNQDNYYSVTNQWARMREERLQRKQLQLEKAQHKAAQQPVVPQVVYVNQAENNHSRNTYYPAYPYGIGYKSYGQGYGLKHNKKLNNYAGRRNTSTCRLPNSTYSRGFARFGTSFGISGSYSSRSHSSRSRGSGLTLSIR